MSIPLDRLYHYIESVAQDVYGDTVIYRFWPHGSKKVDDLNPVNRNDELTILSQPQIFCNDQEPLNFRLYQNYSHYAAPVDTLNKDTQPHFKLNFRKNTFNLFDQCILLHSEKNSAEVEKYKNIGFIPTYYWSHALIARDWFRYAQYVNPCYARHKDTFLIYNRAWCGTREYRLKFSELLVENNLHSICRTSINHTDNNCHYSTYKFQNTLWQPKIKLESYYKQNTATPCYSADFDIDDYQLTNCEIVLETLFDTDRIHLTEKTLRPIALGHPFLLCAPAGSLKYLQSYGFKTFSPIIDESYDQIRNPVDRMHTIIHTMKTIAQLDSHSKSKVFAQLKEIADFNKRHFFSQDFFNLVTRELKTNLSNSLQHLIDSNTYQRCIDLNQTTQCDATYLNWQSQNIDNNLVEINQLVYTNALELKKLHNK